MEPYYEFYSDLDLLLKQIEEMQIKCRHWWVNDQPFKDESPEVWYDMMDKLQEIEDMLNEEPFFKTEE